MIVFLFQLHAFALPQVLGLAITTTNWFALTDLLHTVLRAKNASQQNAFIMNSCMMDADQQVLFKAQLGNAITFV